MKPLCLFPESSLLHLFKCPTEMMQPGRQNECLLNTFLQNHSYFQTGWIFYFSALFRFRHKRRSVRGLEKKSWFGWKIPVLVTTITDGDVFDFRICRHKTIRKYPRVWPELRLAVIIVNPVQTYKRLKPNHQTNESRHHSSPVVITLTTTKGGGGVSVTCC